MKSNFLTKTTQQLLILTGVISMGALSISPALADNHNGMKKSSQDMEEMPMNQGMESSQDMKKMPMNQGMESSQDMEKMPMNQDNAEAGNVVEVALGNKSFSTLVKAVKAAGLADTLSDPNASYTVFAPTNEAFNQLPKGTLEYLLKPENKKVLQQVLSYHVLPEALTSSEISSGKVESLDGGLATEVTDQGVIINNASVVTPDIKASNGVIHGINRVLLPANLKSTLANKLGTKESELYQ